MHEPDIAPLARRLAEENNVDWRRLSGTGEDGRVVERDVLGYLARVMAGDEAIDPTPEPVPEGMEAWPADDVGRYAASDADDDEPTSPPTLDDDLFLFEDPTPPEPGEVDDALFVAPDGGESRGGPVAQEATVPEEEDGHVIEAPSGAEGEREGESEDGVWLVGDDAVEEDAASSVPAEPEAASLVEATDLDGSDAGVEMRIDELPDLTGGHDDVGAHAGEDERARLAGGRDALELPDLFAEEGGANDDAAAVHDDLSLDADARDDAAAVHDDLSLDADVRDDAAAVHDDLSLDADAGPEPLDVGADADAVPDFSGAPSPEPEVAAGPAEAEIPLEPTPPIGARDDGGPAAVPGSAQPALAVSLVRHGQLWRRRIDDRTLRQVASDAAAALDVSPTTVVLLLMARAASRAGVANGSVDAWRWRREGADRLAIDPDAAVHDAAQRIETRAAGADAPPASLVVADLGGMDVDEAVLHLEAPVLALGRSSADGAWLSLSGDDLDGGAASGLARVAELLGSPVRLLL